MTLLHRIIPALSFVTTAAQLIGLDSIPSSTRAYSANARQKVRTLHFWAHARIKPIRLADLVQRLARDPAGSRREIVLPAATAEFGGVGDAAYYYAIATIANTKSPKRVFEFGTYLGVSALTIALNTSPDTLIYTVDLPDEVNPSDTHLTSPTDQGLVGASRYRVGEAFLGHCLENKIFQIKADSLRFSPGDHCGSQPIDMIYVDGGHDFEVCRSDSENALSVLAPDGVILWDDYWWFYPGVVRSPDYF